MWEARFKSYKSLLDIDKTRKLYILYNNEF